MEAIKKIDRALSEFRDAAIEQLDEELKVILNKAAIFHKKNLSILFGMGTFSISAGKNREIELHPDFLDKIEDLHSFAQNDLKRSLSDYQSYYWKPE